MANAFQLQISAQNWASEKKKRQLPLVITQAYHPLFACVVDCAIDGFISDQISLSKGDALGF